MAPFKLKFRMGSSSRTNSSNSSQDQDIDPQVNESLLNQHEASAMGASNSTIDSVDGNSLTSLGNQSERKLLLPLPSNKTNHNIRLGYLNKNHETNEINVIGNVPSSLPKHRFDPDLYPENLHNNQTAIMFEQLSLNEINCNDSIQLYNQKQYSPNLNTQSRTVHDFPSNNPLTNCNLAFNPLNDIDVEDRKESIDSQELLLSNNDEPIELNVMENCTNMECQLYLESLKTAKSTNIRNNNNKINVDNHNGIVNFDDPLMNYSRYCNDDTHRHYEEEWQNNHIECSNFYEIDNQQQQSTCVQPNEMDKIHDTDYDVQNPYDYNDYRNYEKLEHSITPEITSNKSSKEIYKDLAKQWGITCKLSDGCRCMDCQSNYFDCEYEENEHQKTDGGLGAGTPMFISEVMHGTACNIL